MIDGSDPADLSRSPAFKSVNAVLVLLAVLAMGWSIYGTLCNIRRLPVNLSRFPSSELIGRYEAIAALLVTLCGTCIYRTVRASDRKSTVYLNVVGMLVPLLWWILHTTAFYISVSSSFSGRGTP